MFKKVIVPVLIVGISAAIVFQLIRSRKGPKKKMQSEKREIPVQTILVKRGSFPSIIHARAKVSPFWEIDVIPQVVGRVKQINPQLIEGGFVRKNTMLFKVDDTDYQLTLAQAEAALAQARYNLNLVEAQQKSAQKGLELAKKNLNATQLQSFKFSSLAQYQPQYASALANLKSAEAKLEQVKVNLERTIVRAPFDGYLYQVQVSMGQLVSTTRSVGKISAISPLVIHASVPISDLVWLKEGPEETVTVSRSIGGKKHIWRGKIAKLLNRVNEREHLAGVYIVVDAIRSNHNYELPVGIMVDVAMAGRDIENVLRIPQEVVKPGNQVWIFTAKQTLSILDVTIAFRDKHYTYIAEGLPNSAQIITTPIAQAYEGMIIRQVGSGSDQSHKRNKEQSVSIPKGNNR